MLSDEMTTGSVTTSDAEKRSYAARSHAWNLEQRRFREAFPDVSALSQNRLRALSVLFLGSRGHNVDRNAHIIAVLGTLVEYLIRIC